MERGSRRRRRKKGTLCTLMELSGAVTDRKQKMKQFEIPAKNKKASSKLGEWRKKMYCVFRSALHQWSQI